MIRDLYTTDGWVNVPAIRSYMRANNLPFCFCTGGRATGKTYGALQDARKLALADPNGRSKFILVRRTQAQVDIISKQELSPFKRIDLDNAVFTDVRPVSKFTTGFFVEDVPIGYAAALSTFSNMRGFDASDVNLIIFDEFIPEAHEKPIRNESDALLNLYETVNRNRELQGQDPVQLMCYANSNNLANAIFSGLGLISIAEKMEKKHRSEWIVQDRGILLLNLNASPISVKKRATALYRLAGEDSSFGKMALSNSFRSETGSRHGSRNIQEYRPILVVGDLCVYEHKSKEEFYVCDIISGTPDVYGSSKTELQRFKSSCIWLWRYYMSGDIVFRDLETEILFQTYFKV